MNSRIGINLVDFNSDVVMGLRSQSLQAPNQDDEEEQLNHEKIRTMYDCADELVLSYQPNTQTQ